MFTVDLSANEKVAEMLRDAANLLEQQGANPYRVTAYRHAAATVDDLDRSLTEIVAQEGIAGLKALPGIGRGIAATIEEILRTGRSSQLERLRGSLEPEKLLQTVPGIGPALAERIHDNLHIDTLEALEVAAHNGTLESVPGMGRRRAAMVRAALASLLGRLRPRHRRLAGPSVAALLDVDRAYREKAERGLLPTIAPRRFNPQKKSWLPVLHTQRGDWHFTVLFSNTARAHELKRTHDWVVVYFYDDHHEEGQHTIVTETYGPQTGRRVVRGRERECRAYYEAKSGRAH